MTEGTDVASLLRALSTDELVEAVRAAAAERPAVREALQVCWLDSSFMTPLKEATCIPQQFLLTPLAEGACRSTSEQSPVPSFGSREREAPSFRALLRGAPGGWRQADPAAKIVECWSLIFLIIFNVIMFTTIAIAYWMSIGTGVVTDKSFYISSAIDTGWPHRIGDLGISVAFVAYLFVMGTRYIAVNALLEPLPESLARRVHRLSKLALTVEFISSFGGLGVGAFNQSFCYAVHMCFAFTTFGGAVASLFLQTFIDELLGKHAELELPRIQKRWRCVRWCACIVGLVGLIGMFAFGSHGHVEQSAMCELFMAAACFGYYLTWLGSRGTGYIVGFDVFAYSRPAGASIFRLQSMSH